MEQDRFSPGSGSEAEARGSAEKGTENKLSRFLLLGSQAWEMEGEAYPTRTWDTGLRQTQERKRTGVGTRALGVSDTDAGRRQVPGMCHSPEQ